MPRHSWGIRVLTAHVSPLQQKCPLPRQGCPALTHPARPRASVPSTSQPGCVGHPRSHPTSCCHPMPQFPHGEGHSQASSPSLFPFAGKGEGTSLSASPRPTAEPGDCDDLRVRGVSVGFLAPAARSHRLPPPCSALLTSRRPPGPPPQWAPRGNPGTAAQTPALPHCWNPDQQERWQREGTGWWCHWG